MTMKTSDSQSFMDTLKRWTIPLAPLLYVLGFALKLHEYADKLGWRVVAIAAFVVAIAWTVYVWSAKDMTIVEPRTLRPRYGGIPKAVAFVLVVGTAIPVWFSLQLVPEFRVPPLGVRISNPTKSAVQLKAYGEFHLSAVQTPGMDVEVASGRLILREAAAGAFDSNRLSVPPGGELSVIADVVNPQRFERMLLTRELSMRVIIFQSDGGSLTKGGIPFDADVLATSYVTLVVKPSGS